MTLWKQGAALLALGLIWLVLASTEADAATKVRIGLNAGSVSVAGVFIGVERKYFEAEGIEPEVVYFDDPTLITAGVVSGDINVGFLGLAAGTYNAGGNGDLKLIGMAVDEKAGYRSLAIVTSTKQFDSGLSSIASIKGRKIGVNALGSSTQYAPSVIAKKYGFGLTNQNFAPLGALPNIISGIRAGSIDVGIVPGPVAVAAQKGGDIKIIAWVGDEVEFDIAGIFSRADAQQRDALVKFMRGYLKAVGEFDRTFQTVGADGRKVVGKEADELLTIVARGARAPVDTFREALPYLVPDARINVGSISDQINFWKEQKMAPTSVEASKMIDASILEAALGKP